MGRKRKQEGPDSLRSWAIAGAACVINTLLSGISRTTGLFYVALIETYGVSRFQANLPFTMRNVVRNLLGPVVGAIGQRYGPRNVTIAGGVFASLGIILCTFAPNVMWITILWGGMHGIGVALGNTLFQVIVIQYFQIYRATASGLALSGACFGSFVFPILTEYMLNNLGLSGSFLLTGGLVLNVLPAAIMMVEPPWIQRDIKGKTKDKNQHLNMPTISERFSESTQHVSITQVDEASNENDSNGVKRNSLSYSTKKEEEEGDKELNSSRDRSNLSGLDNHAFAESNLELNKTKLDQNQEKVEERERLRAISIGETSITLKTLQTDHQDTSIYKGTVQLLRDPMFHMISLSFAAFNIIFDPALIVIVDYLMDKGISNELAKYFIIILSVGDLLGRLCFGWVTDKNYISVSNFMMGIQIIQGLCFIFMPFFNGVVTLMVLTVIYGVMSGANLIMYPVLVGRYLQSLQSLAMGFICFCSGLLSLGIPPVIGYFRDEIGSYDGMFYITGSLSIVMGCVWLLEPTLLKIRDKLAENNAIIIISL